MLDWRAVALVAAGGALGSVMRFVIQSLVVARYGAGFPWATFAINVAGSFFIGIVLEGFARTTTVVAPLARIFLAVGVLGGFTTFSSFSFEMIALVRNGSPLAALAYAGGSVLLGYAAAFAGAALGRGVAAP